MGSSAAARARSWRQDRSLTELDRRMLAQLEALYGPAGRAAQNSGPIVLGFARRARRSSLALAIRTLVLTGLAIFALWATPQGDAIRGSMVTAVPFLFGQ